MSRYADQVRDEYGRLVPGVSVYVYIWDANAQAAGSLESLTEDDTTSLANPVISDDFGEFHFNAPNGAKLLSYHFGGKVILEQQIQVGPIPTGPPGGDGALFGLFTDGPNVTVASASLLASSGYSQADKGAAVYKTDPAFDLATFPRAGFLSADSVKMRLSTEQEITPQMFGALADGVTDDSAAFVAALAYLKANASTGYGYGIIGGAKLFVPKGIYFLGSTTLDLDFGIILEGESGGLLGPGSSVLTWSAGVTGIRTQAGNTTGATGVKTPVTNAGYATIKNLILQGTYSGTESEAHGIHPRNTICVEDVGIYNFAGDGIHQVASAGSGAPNEGNANSTFFKRVFAQGCRNGFNVDGADTNACTFLHCSAFANRRWGFWDSSFLGNTYIGCSAQTNGVTGSGPPSMVTYSGNRYFVVNGQAAGASTNAPSGTTANNTWWYYYGVGGTATGIAAWVSGTTYREGGAYLTDDSGNASNVFIGCYAEGDQPFAQFVQPTIVIGASIPGAKGVPILVGAASALRIFNGSLIVDTSVLARGNSHDFGPQTGTSDVNIQLYNTNVTSQISFIRYGNAPDATIASTINSLYINAATIQHWRIAGNDIATLDAAGINLQTGKVLTVNGSQVVGTRGTAVTRISRTATSGSLPTPDGSITIANAATPTNAELLEYCTEIEAKLEELTAKFRAATGHGLIA